MGHKIVNSASGGRKQSRLASIDNKTRHQGKRIRRGSVSAGPSLEQYYRSVKDKTIETDSKLTSPGNGGKKGWGALPMAMKEYRWRERRLSPTFR